MKRFIFIMTGNNIEMGALVYDEAANRISIDWHRHQDEYGYDVRSAKDLDGFWQWFQQESGVTRDDTLAVMVLCEDPIAVREIRKALHSRLDTAYDLAVGADNCWDARDWKDVLADHLRQDDLTYDEQQQVFQSGNRQWFATGLSGLAADVALRESPSFVESDDDDAVNPEEGASDPRVFLRPDEPERADVERDASESAGLGDDSDAGDDLGKCTGADIKSYLTDATKDHCDTVR